MFVLPGLRHDAPALQGRSCKGQEKATPEKKRGVGISIGIYKSASEHPDRSEAWAELTPEGVTIYNCWEDPGQGGDIGTLMTAHESLRPLAIPPDKIRLVMNDMGLAPNSGAVGGEQAQVMTGGAIKAACEQLIAAMSKENGSYRTYEEMVAEISRRGTSGKHGAGQHPEIPKQVGREIPEPHVRPAHG